MFPIRDHNPSTGTAYVTHGLIALNVAVFALTFASTGDPHFMADWALIPALSSAPTYLTSQFLHGGLLHLAGNMLFLWIFGDNLEDRMGALPFLGFYLASGVAAGLAQTLSDPVSTIPMIGASGAIAGVMGGYLLLFPRARVDVLFIFVVFFKIFPIPAWIVLGVWFAIQVASGAATPSGMGGVAYWAHAGGFMAGLALTVPLFLRLGGTAFWARTAGHPPHPEAQYRTRRSPIPRAGRRR
ncbi:rhomboid family intramembrane serine protease [Palleronia rufa]|uniref:rhomboid family intramembrane serine protease n=1 Tax=Palleronia rufa TaxID=1530186 RepID=UPI000563938D|nr:rhomboid family intramembrane serine protease [Palleronia rufa]